MVFPLPVHPRTITTELCSMKEISWKCAGTTKIKSIRATVVCHRIEEENNKKQKNGLSLR